MKEIEQITFWLQKALIGEVYDNLFAVSFELDEKMLVMHYYITCEPNDDDYEKADVVLTNLLSHTSGSEQIKEVKIHCHKSNNSYSEIKGITVFAKSLDGRIVG